MTIVSECTVCTDILTNEDHVTVVPCGHMFHKACVQTWFKQCKTNPVCPICRAKAPKSRTIDVLYFSIPNSSILSQDESPSKNRSRLTNKISSLEANLLKAERERQNSEKNLEKLKEKLEKLETENCKAKKKEEVAHHRLSAMKQRMTSHQEDRDRFEVMYNSAAERLKKLEGLETDRILMAQDRYNH